MLAAARAGSLFAASRAVVVRRAELLKYASAPQDDEAPADAKGRGKARSDEDPVDAYADAPAPDATLVLVAAKPDRRRRPWKSLLAKAEVHDAAPRKGRALRAHVEQELKRRGLRFTRDALDQLIEEVGQDLRRLMGEVDKLEAWADGRAEITSEDVASVLGRGLGQPLYLLSDAFAARDAPKSLELLERLLGDGEEGLRVLATLHRTLRQVRGAVALREAGAPRPQIGARLLPAEHAVQARRAPRRLTPLERARPGAGARRDGPDRPGNEAGSGRGRGAHERHRRVVRRGGYFAAASALTLRVSRLLYRAAALSWMTPFFAALSIWPTVPDRSDSAALALPSAMAARSFFTWVLSWETFCLLRARRLTPCRFCFWADA